MNRNILKIVLCFLILIIGIGAAQACEYDSADEAVALDDNDDAVAVQSEDAGEVSSNGDSEVLSVENEDAVCGEVPAVSDGCDSISTSISKDSKLTAPKEKDCIGYGSAYKTFKGKSHYKWKIKKSKWNKMKKQAKKEYKHMRKIGSSYPGCSHSVKVKVKIGGHIYSGIALAIKNDRGMRCEVRGLPNGSRLSTWGDTL